MTIVTVILVLLLGGSQTLPRVSIYVGPQVRDGFVDMDAGIRDSIRDIQNELRRSSAFTVATDPAQSDVQLIVLGRRISGTAGAVGVQTPGVTIGGGMIAGVPQPTFTTPGTTSVATLDRRAIDTLIRVRSYEKPITSEDESGSGVWRAVAQRVVRDLVAWVEANRATLAGSGPP